MFIIQEDVDYNKLRGVLVLIAVMLFYFAIMLFGTIVSDQFKNFMNGSFSSFINRNSRNYDPVLAIKMILDIVCYIILFVFNIYLIVLFFKRRYPFPKLLIVFLVFHLSLFLTDYILITAGINHPDAFDSRHFLAVIFKNLILFIILIVYLLESEQVKETFKR